jgi:hypothetical protein
MQAITEWLEPFCYILTETLRLRTTCVGSRLKTPSLHQEKASLLANASES